MSSYNILNVSRITITISLTSCSNLSAYQLLALGLVWDPEGDTLRIDGKKFVDANTKREMISQLASQFDPLGVVSPLLLRGKLILQKVVASKIDWDETLPDNFRKEWKKWLITSNTLEDYSIPRNLLLEGTEPVSGAVYQLYGFCDASDSAYSCVVYLRGLHEGKSLRISRCVCRVYGR